MSNHLVGSSSVLDRATAGEVMRFATGGSELLKEMTMSGYGEYRTSMVTERGMKYVGAYNPGQVSNSVKMKMLKDPQIKLGIAACQAPILTAPWTADCESRELKAILEHTLIEPWIRRIVRDGLSAVEFGYQVDEILWEHGVNSFGWEDDDGVEKKTDFTGYNLRGLKDLHPNSLKFILNAKTGTTVGITQQVGTGLEDIQKNLIPMSKLLHFTHASRWGNPYGDGRLENVYDPWYWCVVIYLFLNQYFERRAVPTAKVFMPPGTTIKDPTTGTASGNPTQTLADQMQSRLKSHSVLVFESIFDPGSHERLWDAEFMQSDPRGEMFLKYIEHLQVMKLRGLLVPERVVTQDAEVGSNAMAKTHKGTGNLMAVTLLDSIQETINRQLFPVWCAANGITEKIQVQHGGIAEEAEELYRGILEMLHEAELAILKGEAVGDISGHMVDIVDRMRLLKRLNIPLRDSAAKNLTPKHEGGTPSAKPKEGKVQEKIEADLADLRFALVEAPASPKEATLSMTELRAMYGEWGGELEEEIEAWTEPQREEIGTREKVAAALMALVLLRAKKEGPDGGTIAGDSALMGLVYNGAGGLRPLSRVADNLPKLRAALDKMKDKYPDGIRLAASGNRGLLGKFTRDVNGVIGEKSLKEAVESRVEVDALVNRAMSLASTHYTAGGTAGGWGIGANLRAILRGGYPGRKRGKKVPGEPEFRGRANNILDVNVAGILANVENIAIRASRGIIETLRNAFGSRRTLARALLSLTSEVQEWHLHPTYTEETLRSHLRAAYRGAMLQVAETGGLSYFLGIHPPGSPEETGPRGGVPSCRDLDGTVATEKWWNARGEKAGQAAPMEQFGMGWNCRMQFFPVPDSVLIAEGVKVKT